MQLAGEASGSEEEAGPAVTVQTAGRHALQEVTCNGGRQSVISVYSTHSSVLSLVIVLGVLTALSVLGIFSSPVPTAT